MSLNLEFQTAPSSRHSAHSLLPPRPLLRARVARTQVSGSPPLSSGSGLAPLTLSGIVFKNGMHAIANSGGGLAVHNGAVVIVVACNFQNCEIRGIEGGGGGAIGVFDSGSSLTLTGNIFKDNIVPTGADSSDYTADVHAGPGTDVYFNVGDCPEPFSPSLPPVDSAPEISFNLAPNQAVLQPPCAFPTQSPTPAPTAEATAAPTHSNWFEDTTVECGFLSLGSTLSHCCDVARDISLVPAGGDARDYVSAAVGVDSSSCRKSLLCGGGGRRRLQPGTGGGQGPPLGPLAEEEEEERQIGFCRELINGAVAEVVDEETAATVSSLMDAQCDVVAITEDIGLAGVECVGEPTGDELLVVADQGDVTMANLLERKPPPRLPARAPPIHSPTVPPPAAHPRPLPRSPRTSRRFHDRRLLRCPRPGVRAAGQHGGRPLLRPRVRHHNPASGINT